MLMVMLVFVFVELVVRAEFVWFAVTVVVAVFVDDHRGAIVADETSAERFGEQRGHQHLARCPVGQHAAGEQHHPIGASRLREMMRREHDRSAGSSGIGDDVQDAELTGEVETGDRLVEQEQSRVGGERLGDEDSLLLAAREFAERSTPEVGHLELLGCVVDERTVASLEATEQSTLSVAPHPQYLVDRQRHPAVMVAVLGDERHRPCRLDPAVARLEQAGEQRDQRGLAAAVRSDERDGGAPLQFEARRGEGGQVAVVDARVGDAGTEMFGEADDGRGCHEIGSHSSLLGMILTRSPRRLLAAASAAMLTLAACGGDDDTGGGSETADEAGADGDSTTIVATTSIWADVTSNVACGAEIPALIPAGADPHNYEASLQDRELVENSSTVIANGLELEEPILPMLQVAADESGVNVIELANDVDILMPADDHDHDDHDDEDHDDEDHDDEDHDDEVHDDEDDHGHSHDHDGGDPHFWQDPLRVSGTLDTIGTAVAADGLDECVADYRAELEALDTEITELLAPIPDESRVLVTSHESLSYFADRYDFEVIGTVIPSMSTMAETNAADLAELADEIEYHGVTAIFTDAAASSADAEALGERLGVSVVALVTDSLTDDADSDTYVEMMRHNATLIAEQLAP